MQKEKIVENVSIPILLKLIPWKVIWVTAMGALQINVPGDYPPPTQRLMYFLCWSITLVMPLITSICTGEAGLLQQHFLTSTKTWLEFYKNEHSPFDYSEQSGLLKLPVLPKHQYRLIFPKLGFLKKCLAYMSVHTHIFLRVVRVDSGLANYQWLLWRLLELPMVKNNVSII
jgi:hypothetical protein